MKRFLLTCFCVWALAGAWAQTTYNDGPIRLRVWVNRCFISASHLSAGGCGNYNEAFSGGVEPTMRLRVRDNADIDGVGYQAQQAFELPELSDAPTSPAFDDTRFVTPNRSRNMTSGVETAWGGAVSVFDHTYTGANVPTNFDWDADGWEDDDGGWYDYDNCSGFTNDDVYRAGTGTVNFRAYLPGVQHTIIIYFGTAGAEEFAFELLLQWDYVGSSPMVGKTFCTSPVTSDGALTLTVFLDGIWSAADEDGNGSAGAEEMRVRYAISDNLTALPALSAPIQYTQNSTRFSNAGFPGGAVYTATYPAGGPTPHQIQYSFQVWEDDSGDLGGCGSLTTYDTGCGNPDDYFQSVTGTFNFRGGAPGVTYPFQMPVSISGSTWVSSVIFGRYVYTLAAPTIATIPDVTVCTGTPTSLSAVVEADNVTYYQWQQGSTGNCGTAVFADIPGANCPTYALPAGVYNTPGTYTFRLVGQNRTGTGSSTAAGAALQTVTSNCITVTVSNTSTVWTGNVSTDWFNAANWTCGLPNCTRDAIIPDVTGTTNRFPVLNGGTGSALNLSLTGNPATAQLTVGATGTLDLCGNLNKANTNPNSSVFQAGSAVRFVGVAPQSVTGNFLQANGNEMNNITVNATGPISLNNTLELDGNLTLISGIVRTNANQLVQRNTAAASVLGGSVGTYVWGTLRRQTAIAFPVAYNFPVGDDPAGKGFNAIAFSFSTPADFTSLTVSFSPTHVGAYPTTAECGNNGYDGWAGNGQWSVVSTASGPNLGTYTVAASPRGITFGNAGNYTPITGNASATVAKRNGVAPWALEGTCVPGLGTSNLNTLAPIATRAGITSGFSDFGVVVDNNEPFPVELLGLNATPADNAIVLDWATASETNNAGFDLQRSLNPAEGFESLVWVPGAGQSSSLQHYGFTDTDVLPNRSYFYRLRQLDFDGAVALSNVVEARLGSTSPQWVAFPVPTTGSLMLQGPAGAGVSAQVTNLAGQVVLRNQALNENGRTPLDLSSLPAGVYAVEVLLPNAGREVLRVVKH